MIVGYTLSLHKPHQRKVIMAALGYNAIIAEEVKKYFLPAGRNYTEEQEELAEIYAQNACDALTLPILPHRVNTEMPGSLPIKHTFSELYRNAHAMYAQAVQLVEYSDKYYQDKYPMAWLTKKKLQRAEKKIIRNSDLPGVDNVFHNYTIDVIYTPLIEHLTRNPLTEHQEPKDYHHNRTLTYLDILCHQVCATLPLFTHNEEKTDTGTSWQTLMRNVDNADMLYTIMYEMCNNFITMDVEKRVYDSRKKVYDNIKDLCTHVRNGNNENITLILNMLGVTYDTTSGDDLVQLFGYTSKTPFPQSYQQQLSGMLHRAHTGDNAHTVLWTRS